MTKKTKQKNPVSDAARKLRLALGESQQAFAYRMKTAIRTIARYETVRPPKGKALADFFNLANQIGNPVLAKVFRDALIAEIGVTGKFAQLGALASHTIPGIHSDLALLLNHLEYRSGTQQAKIDEAIQTLKAVLPEVEKLNLYLPKPTQARAAVEGEDTE